MKKLIIITVLFLTACGSIKVPDGISAGVGAEVISQDHSVAISQDQTKPIEKPLTLKEKISIAAKEFEQLKTSYQPFCSKTPKDLNLFYTTLFYEMIRFESSFNTNEVYYECAKAKCYYSAGCFTDPDRGFCRITSSKMDGGFAVSRGLTQLSVSSVQGLGCKDFIKTAEDLHNPDLNLKCAMIIAKNYFIQDKIITGKVDDKWKGLSRYWAVFRPTFEDKPRESYVKITKAIQKIEGCN